MATSFVKAVTATKEARESLTKPKASEPQMSVKPQVQGPVQPGVSEKTFRQTGQTVSEKTTSTTTPPSSGGGRRQGPLQPGTTFTESGGTEQTYTPIKPLGSLPSTPRTNNILKNYVPVSGSGPTVDNLAYAQQTGAGVVYTTNLQEKRAYQDQLLRNKGVDPTGMTDTQRIRELNRQSSAAREVIEERASKRGISDYNEDGTLKTTGQKMEELQEMDKVNPFKFKYDKSVEDIEAAKTFVGRPEPYQEGAIIYSGEAGRQLSPTEGLVVAGIRTAPPQVTQVEQNRIPFGPQRPEEYIQSRQPIQSLSVDSNFIPTQRANYERFQERNIESGITLKEDVLTLPITGLGLGERGSLTQQDISEAQQRAGLNPLKILEENRKLNIERKESLKRMNVQEKEILKSVEDRDKKLLSLEKQIDSKSMSIPNEQENIKNLEERDNLIESYNTLVSQQSSDISKLRLIEESKGSISDLTITEQRREEGTRPFIDRSLSLLKPRRGVDLKPSDISTITTGGLAFTEKLPEAYVVGGAFKVAGSAITSLGETKMFAPIVSKFKRTADTAPDFAKRIGRGTLYTGAGALALAPVVAGGVEGYRRFEQIGQDPLLGAQVGAAEGAGQSASYILGGVSGYSKTDEILASQNTFRNIKPQVSDKKALEKLLKESDTILEDTKTKDLKLDNIQDLRKRNYLQTREEFIVLEKSKGRIEAVDLKTGNKVSTEDIEPVYQKLSNIGQGDRIIIRKTIDQVPGVPETARVSNVDIFRGRVRDISTGVSATSPPGGNVNLFSGGTRINIIERGDPITGKFIKLKRPINTDVVGRSQTISTDEFGLKFEPNIESLGKTEYVYQTRVGKERFSTKGRASATTFTQRMSTSSEDRFAQTFTGFRERPSTARRTRDFFKIGSAQDEPKTMYTETLYKPNKVEVRGEYEIPKITEEGSNIIIDSEKVPFERKGYDITSRSDFTQRGAFRIERKEKMPQLLIAEERKQLPGPTPKEDPIGGRQISKQVQKSLEGERITKVEAKRIEEKLGLQKAAERIPRQISKVEQRPTTIAVKRSDIGRKGKSLRLKQEGEINIKSPLQRTIPFSASGLTLGLREAKTSQIPEMKRAPMSGMQTRQAQTQVPRSIITTPPVYPFPSTPQYPNYSYIDTVPRTPPFPTIPFPGGRLNERPAQQYRQPFGRQTKYQSSLSANVLNLKASGYQAKALKTKTVFTGQEQRLVI